MRKNKRNAWLQKLKSAADGLTPEQMEMVSKYAKWIKWEAENEKYDKLIKPELSDSEENHY